LDENVIHVQDPIPRPRWLSLDLWSREDGGAPLFYNDCYKSPYMPLFFVEVEIWILVPILIYEIKKIILL
jgi:hypothetical protein